MDTKNLSFEKYLNHALKFYEKVYGGEFLNKIKSKIKSNEIKFFIFNNIDEIPDPKIREVFLDKNGLISGHYSDSLNTIFIRNFEHNNDCKCFNERRIENIVHELSHAIYHLFPRDEIFQNLREPYKSDILDIISLAEKIFGEKRPDPAVMEKLYFEDELIAYYMGFKYLLEDAYKGNVNKLKILLVLSYDVDRYICWVEKSIKNKKFGGDEKCYVDRPNTGALATVVYYFLRRN